MATPTLGGPPGNMRPRAQVIRENYVSGKTVRENLENIPDRLSGQLAVETDPAVVRALLADEIRHALAEILRQGVPPEEE